MAANSTAAWPGEDSFGPASTERFDFTLLFEQAFLRVVLSVLLLLLVPLRLFYLRRRRPRVLGRALGRAKLIICFVFAAMHLTVLALWANRTPTRGAPIAASSLSVLVTLFMALASQAEHVRSHRPSTLICVYLMLSIGFDATICRTLWLLPDARVLASVSTGTLAAEVAVLAVELQDKRNHLIGAWKNLGPEATAGIVSRALFWWLNELMIRGFQATLSMASLHQLDEELQAKAALDKTRDFQQRPTFRDRHKYRLLVLVLGCHKTALLLAVIPRLCLMGFTFAQPFLINRVIKYVEGDKGPDPRSYAYGLMGATALAYLGLAFSRSLYKYRAFRSMTMIRACLVIMILDRAVDLNNPSQDLGSGTLSLMSSDAEQIVQSFEDFHEIWANPIEIAVAIWLLARILGVGAIGPAVPFLVCTFILMPPVAKRMGPAMKLWNAAIQKRVSVTSDIVGAIKEVKLLGATAKWSNIIQGLRKTELEQSKRFRGWIVVMNVVANMPPFLAPLLTFGLAIAISTADAQLLTVANVFTSISIISMIVSPLASLLSAIPNFASSFGSFERIQKFLDEVDSQVGKMSVQQGLRNLDSRQTEKRSQVSDRDRPPENPIITFKNASFGPSSTTGSPLLQDVNVSIQKSTITLVTGPVGSGKTTLLKALLGDFPVAGSSDQSPIRAAYCAQNPWLTNASIRRNIVSYNEFDEAWYRIVLHASALDNDLDQLSSGDQTIIGSKGISLSGGQQQRISLARALYSRQQVLILDDVLSGLDSTTKAEVWARTFGPKGILRQQQATVVLATHSLRHLHEVDSIILIDFHDDIRFLKQDKEDENLDKTHRSAEIGAQKLPNKVVNMPKDDHEEQDLLRKAGDISLYGYYFKSIGWSSSIIFIGSNMLATIGVISPQLWLKAWSEANSRDQGTNNGWYFGIFVMICILGLVTEGVAIWAYFVNAVPRSANNLHWALLKAVMKAPLAFFVTTDLGDIINRFSQDMSLIDKALPTALFMAVRLSFMAIAEAVLVFLGAKYLAAIIPVVIIALYVLGVFYLRTSRQVRFLDLQAKAPLYTHLLETVDGLATIRAFGWQMNVRDAGKKLLDASLGPYYLLFLIQRWLNVVLDLFVAVAAFLLVTFSVLFTESTTPAYVAIALYNIMSFNSTLAQLISSWTSLETSLGAISRLRTFEETTPAECVPAPGSSIPNGWPGSGAISITNISASYPRMNQAQESPSATAPALKEITLDIKPGEKIGICGRTGSGKSSLISTLPRLLELDEGRILIDGVDISTLDLATLRNGLVSVPQQSVVFPESVRSYLNQISSSEDATMEAKKYIHDDQALVDALTKVGLWSLVSTHRGTAGHGLDAEVSELPLSQGQKQLMCFARALLRRGQSRILLLDEATSAVDRSTEELMMQLIQTKFSEHTVVSVAHHLDTLQRFDRVVVMAKGEIVETGEPGELLKRPDGKYRELWES
ncbi:uncharacterized protein JN550_008026 [Neoarthrinium moseri]|uniref:uncharacterized protein n=1 Tax=Neoarthrinium moseri TaxID=1658444 RepID=UPI001FDC48E8|nr:uncharacterized protein JN550_008026 [Neoarthrinium moseri]KAI1866048.1 hypothetical protein JN550_008026 [Neoarthrinium moseri]